VSRRGINIQGQHGRRRVSPQGPHTGPAIGVALKLTPRRIEVDPVTGETTPDRAPGSASAAGLAALEIALRLREVWHSRVTVATVDTAAADPMLRDALARGADNAIRMQLPPGCEMGPPGMPAALGAAADALAAAFAGHPVVLCGDGGHGSGTGAVPALLAARARRAQALGLTSVEPAQQPATVHVERRLDRGWRERLVVRAPMVLAVEGGTARPRRAPLDAVLAVGSATIAVAGLAATGGDGWGGGADATAHQHGSGAVTILPYRPRARILQAPEGESPLARVLSLLGSGGERKPPERVDAEPAAAAQQILDKLRGWGYL